jgi:hypothetical protein
MSEWTEEQWCKRYAEESGGALLKLLPFAVRGLPDRLLLLPRGLVCFVEMKVLRGDLRPSQGVWRKRLLRMGMNYAVVRSKADFLEVCRYLMLGHSIPTSLQDDRQISLDKLPPRKPRLRL